MHYSLRYALTGIIFLAIVAAVPPRKKPKFIDPANMDTSVKPGENFYLYANGGWLKNNPIPPSKTSWGSFGELREESSRRLKLLLEETATKGAKNPKFQKIGDFYASGMDSLAIQKLGYQPVMPHLERIEKIQTVSDLLNEIATLRTKGVANPLFGFFIAQDRKRSDQYIPSLSQGGTTLSDRDYYLKSDSRSVRIRAEYQTYLNKIFQLTGNSEADSKKKADAIMRIETALAKMQMPRVEMRDPQKTYNKFSLKDFSVTTPSIDWTVLLGKLKVSGADSVVVNNPTFFKAADALLTAVPVQDWKTYLQWNILKAAAPHLSNDFVQANFEFNKVVSGQKQLSPRWQRMSSTIDGSLGELLGELYVERYFKPEAKKRMIELVNNLETALEERIQGLDWMTNDTKTQALQKLKAFAKKIGYPDKWKDYSAVTIDRNDYLGNIHRTNEWSYNEMVSRFGKPIDKTLWGMTPPTVNAYYNPVNNEIAFPAGILQFPFFDNGADDALNYGGIGAVIGHEMIHGFDDSGRQYAHDGNLRDWWTKEDADRFKEKADMVVELFNGFTVLDSLHVNGRLTLGENIADFGGLSIAYEAFTKTKQFKEGKLIDGFTPAQRFFLNWAQVWRVNMLPESQAQQVLTDPHSPGMYRTNGPLMNMDAFYEAFNIKEGDKMYLPKEKRIRIW
jgi:Predicted metalloendopeptidase